MSITSRQAKALDLKARKVFGISTLALMENAGACVADEAMRLGRRKIAVFCGKGNNAGDGFVAVRHLLAKGIKPDIFLIAPAAGVHAEARVNLNILRKLRQRICQVNEKQIPLVRRTISRYGLIIDALLGVGLSGPVKGVYADVIHLINCSRAYVMAVDVPSGLDATTGRALGCCVQADLTVTFMAKKKGMLKTQGPAACGRIIVKDIGLPLTR
jgi:hydroxyethylthiazole kinase-like uncharacterized protein yjeF